MYVAWLCVSTFTVTSLLPPASQFLKAYEDEFIGVVNAKQSLFELKRKGVISQAVRESIEAATDEDAKYLLFDHLQKNATADTLKEYCKVAIAADGFPRMQALGRKMMEALPSGGWLELWSRLQAWVGVCVSPAGHIMSMLAIIVYACGLCPLCL